jgi:trans-aconitate 2-methyltransferase
MSGSAFRAEIFTAPAARIVQFTDLFLRYLRGRQVKRVLDLGCGTGEQVRALAARLPRTEFVGIDVSPRNIAVARERSRGLDARVRFVDADYLEYRDQPFEAIVADSVLQNIETDDAPLYRKLAGDLAAQGLLAITIPYECAYNGMLWRTRRLARHMRGPRFDALMLALAKRMHGDWDEAMLRERLPYLYLLPRRFDSAAMRETLGRHGLIFVDAESLPHASPAQPRHRFVAYQRAMQ